MKSITITLSAEQLTTLSYLGIDPHTVPLRQMVDGATLTQLDEEEITDLATRAEDGLVPYIE